MTSANDELVIEAVLQKARRQTYVTPRDVQEELRLVGRSNEEWRGIVKLARSHLLLRQGRYYLKESMSPRLLQELAQQQMIQKVIRGLVKRYRERLRHDDRRGQSRVDFIQSVQVQTEDGRTLGLLSRDISATGIRLLGTSGLLGQKLHVLLPRGEGEAPCRLLTRVLWTCAVGDKLFENGGSFLAVEE